MSLVVVLTVGDNIEHCFQSPVCTSKYGNRDFCKWKMAIKWGKLHRKKIGMVPTVGDDVGQCFQGTVHISKYGKHVYHLADCGEFQCECLNTTRPRLQVPSFKATFFKSSCCNFTNNSVLHTINQGQREGLYHWQQCEQVPLTFTYEEATQESSRNVKSNMTTISFPNMDASKIYLWARYILSKIYFWEKYIYEQSIYWT